MTGYTYPAHQQYPSQIEGLPEIYARHIGYKPDGCFVEVGAFNCVNWSNTLMLAEAGWRGVLIEPVGEYFGECERLYADNLRITLRQCCVGGECGTVRLYLGGSNSTINPEAIELYNSVPGLDMSGLSEDSFIDCPCHTLDCILEASDLLPPLDVLSIDVEKAELQVLSGFSLSHWRPALAIVETHAMHPDPRLRANAKAIDAVFAPHHYWKCYEDYINTVYVRDRRE